MGAASFQGALKQIAWLVSPGGWRSRLEIVTLFLPLLFLVVVGDRVFDLLVALIPLLLLSFVLVSPSGVDRAPGCATSLTVSARLHADHAVPLARDLTPSEGVRG